MTFIAFRAVIIFRGAFMSTKRRLDSRNLFSNHVFNSSLPAAPRVYARHGQRISSSWAKVAMPGRLP